MRLRLRFTEIFTATVVLISTSIAETHSYLNILANKMIRGDCDREYMQCSVENRDYCRQEAESSCSAMQFCLGFTLRDSLGNFDDFVIYTGNGAECVPGNIVDRSDRDLYLRNDYLDDKYENIPECALVGWEYWSMAQIDQRRVQNENACQFECFSTDGCEFWVTNYIHNTYRSCHLHPPDAILRISDATQDSYVTGPSQCGQNLGVPNCAIIDAEYWASNAWQISSLDRLLYDITMNQPVDCQRICDENNWTFANQDCKYWTFANQNCWFTDASGRLGNTDLESGRIAGPKYCPSNAPTLSFPSKSPSTSTAIPSMSPSRCPSYTPSLPPSAIPTAYPSPLPTLFPSEIPTNYPTQHPSILTSSPSTPPSNTPSFHPSPQPSSNPSPHPSQTPTIYPTSQPSTVPSKSPNDSPTTQPSRFPSNAPSQYPSIWPTTIIPTCSFPTSTPTTQDSIATPTIAPIGNLTPTIRPFKIQIIPPIVILSTTVPEEVIEGNLQHGDHSSSNFWGMMEDHLKHPEDGSWLLCQAMILIVIWLFIVLWIISRRYIDCIEKRQDLVVWTKATLGFFDLCSDAALTLYMKYNGYYMYFYFLLAIVLVSSMKSIMLIAYRAPSLLRESQVPSWRTRTNGGFSILPLLFIFCGLSPLYYDLLLTSQIGFPIRPSKRGFIVEEKMIHIICENVTSICVALSFIYMEESDNMVAIVSLISSIIMTFCMLFTVGCVLIFTNKTKSLHSANVRILLDRDKFTDSNPSKRKLKRAIKSIMADSSCSVNVWYLCKLPRHYEIHVFLQTYKVGLKLHEEDIKRMISKTFKDMDLSIRRSIQISSAEIAGVMNSNYFSRISDKSSQIEMTNTNTDVEGYYFHPEIFGTSSSAFKQKSLEPMYENSSVASSYPHELRRLERHQEVTYINWQEHDFQSDSNLTQTPERSLTASIYSPTFLRSNKIPSDWNLQLERIQSAELLSINDIELDLEDMIGKGNFGKVYVGLYRGAQCAFKQFNGYGSYLAESTLFREVSKHPCICRYYGICKYDADTYFLVMEYFEDGSMLDYVKRQKLTNEEKLHVCLELSKGIWHLHLEKVLHGDLALRNVLFNRRSNRVALSDFGQSCRSPCAKKVKTLAPRWASPQLMKSRIMTMESDIWGLAVTFWELYSNGARPYNDLSITNVVSFLANKKLCPECDESWPITPLLEKIFENPDADEFTAHWMYLQVRRIQRSFLSRLSEQQL